MSNHTRKFAADKKGTNDAQHRLRRQPARTWAESDNFTKVEEYIVMSPEQKPWSPFGKTPPQMESTENFEYDQSLRVRDNNSS